MAHVKMQRSSTKICARGTHKQQPKEPIVDERSRKKGKKI
jgi:hypothetical protein